MGASSDLERTRRLVTQMRACRGTIMHALDACREPMAARELAALLDEELAVSCTVFDAGSVSEQLRASGALALIDAEGRSFDAAPDGAASGEDAGLCDESDGAEGREVRQAFWKTTRAGLDVLAEYRPLDEFAGVLAAEDEYREVYLGILDELRDEPGVKTDAFEDELADELKSHRPRLFATHFLDRLERCGVIEWRAGWRLTQVGQTALESLGREREA